MEEYTVDSAHRNAHELIIVFAGSSAIRTLPRVTSEYVRARVTAEFLS